MHDGCGYGMGTFSDRALAIQPTGVRKMFDLAGDDVISFGLGEPDFQPPSVAIEAFYQAMLDGRNKYTTTAGLPALRKKIAASWSAYQNGMDENNVCMTMSGTNALLNLFMTLINPGQNILLPEPYFPLYGPDATLVGGEAKYYPCLFEHEFIPQVSDLEEMVDEHTVAILYNFPSNPTGGTLDEQQRDDLLAFAEKHDLWIISDEVYDTMIWQGEHVSPRTLPGMAERTLVVGSMSKSHAMTGSRIGWIIGPEEAIEHLGNLSTHTTYGVAGFVQEAATFALSQGDAFETGISQPFRRRRDLVIDMLEGQNAVRAIPADGGMFVMLDVRATGLSGEDFADRLLTEHLVGVMPGESFGKAAAGHIRVALTVDDDRLAGAIGLLIELATELAA